MENWFEAILVVKGLFHDGSDLGAWCRQAAYSYYWSSIGYASPTSIRPQHPSYYNLHFAQRSSRQRKRSKKHLHEIVSTESARHLFAEFVRTKFVPVYDAWFPPRFQNSNHLGTCGPSNCACGRQQQCILPHNSTYDGTMTSVASFSSHYAAIQWKKILPIIELEPCKLILPEMLQKSWGRQHIGNLLTWCRVPTASLHCGSSAAV